MTASATGTLAATPLAHALIYARNRRLTGRLDLVTSDDRQAIISLWRGSITSVALSPVGMCPGGFFGAIAYELGFIDSDMLDKTLLEIAKTKRLHGEVLIERKAITPAQRDEALVEQIHRKIHFLFSLPEDTKYAFYDSKAPSTNANQSFAPVGSAVSMSIEPPVAVDCVGPVWRGIRDYPPTKFVDETSRRVGDHALRASAGGSARLPPLEAELFGLLATRAMTLAEMKMATELPAPRVELLVYLLVIAKNVEAVSGARTHPSTGALPVGMPSGPVRPPSGETRRASGEVSAAVAAAIPPTGPRRISSGSITAVRTPGVPIAPGSQPRIPAAGQPTSPSTTTTLITLKSPAELGQEGVVARARAIDDESFFQMLGVPEGASAEAVRAAYMRLSKTWHPDRLHADFTAVRGEVAKIFSQMTRAQQTLCDPDARRVYVGARNAQTSRPRDEVIREVEQDVERRQWDRVVQSCQALIDLDTDDSEAMAIQAWATTRGGEATEEELRAALTKMDRAVNIDRTNDAAVFHRGLVHKRLGNVPASFRDFARALQLNPSHTAAEREVRILAMRVKKGSGEHKLIAPILDRLDMKK